MELISRVEAKAQGLKRFFTGVACKHGHISERQVYAGTCCTCHSIHHKTPEAKAKKAIVEQGLKDKRAARRQTPEWKAYMANYSKRSDVAAKRNTQQEKQKRAARAAAWAKANPEKVAAWATANPEKAKASNYKWRKTNPEKVRAQSAAYRAANPEKVAAKNAAWAKANPHLAAAAAARRRAAKLERTPKWLTKADKAAIKAIYEQANFMSRVCGEPMHVDHIYPLQGKTVSGLHVPLNLQILTATENISKNNRYDPSSQFSH